MRGISPWSPGQSIAWPMYPGREVFVLSGEWDFAFLGGVDVKAAATVREEDLCRRVTVPDAFDAREWLCGTGDSGHSTCSSEEGQACRSCCDLSRGDRGDERCWQGGQGWSFEQCCDAPALGRRGVAAYRTFIPRRVTLLHFWACAMYCAVYVGRRLVGEHVGGYSPFWVDLHDGSDGLTTGGDAELLVVADNRFSDAWPVHQPYFDMYQPGGLLRAVEAHALRQPSLRIELLEVLPDQRQLGLVTLRLRLSSGCVGRGLRAALEIDASGFGPPRPVAAAHAEEAWRELVPEPRPWSLGSPALHTATLSLLHGGVEVDRATARFGLRTVAAAGGRILLNDLPVMLLGANRHEEHPLGGAALPLEQLRGDMALLKELGANFVRGSHYSQDQRWLDLCDEEGMLVWEETLAWQPRLEDLTDAQFMDQQLVALDETLNASMSHPAVVVWGFLNEAETDSPAARPAHQFLKQLVEGRDQTRLVTWASRHKMKDETLDLADVISFNDYPGWYDATVQEIPQVWESYAKWVREHHPGKAFLISEVGASGLVRFRNEEMAMWSEELQAAIVESSIVTAYALGLAGIILWQLTDSRVDRDVFFADNPRKSPFPDVPDARWVEHMAVRYAALASPYGSHRPLRPRGLNNKGLVSLDRGHRKLAFGAAQRAFRGACALPTPSAPPRRAAAGPFRLSVGPPQGPPSPATCQGCFLALHTWNVADRLTAEHGVRVHGHAWADRASVWSLGPGGLLRLQGHVAGHKAAVGGFLAVGTARGGGAAAASSAWLLVRDAASSLWAFEAVPGGVLLRVAFGSYCGAYLSFQASSAADRRDEQSFFAHVQYERHLASVLEALPPA